MGPLEEQEQESSFFQPLGIRSTFHRVIKVFCKHWGVFLAVNTVAILLTYVAKVVAGLILAEFLVQSTQTVSQNDFAIDDNGNAYHQQKHPTIWIGLFVQLTLHYIILSVADGATIRAVAEVYAERVPTIWECVKHEQGKIGSLLVACFVIGLLLLVPFGAGLFIVYLAGGKMPLLTFVVFFLVFASYGSYVTVVTYVVYPVIVVEEHSGLAAIGRSMRLLDGHCWHVFAVLSLFGTAKTVVNAISTRLTGSDNRDVLSADGGIIISIFLAILFTTLGSIFQAVIYFDIRVKTESYTLETMCVEIGLANDSTNASYVSMKHDGGKENQSQSSKSAV